MRRTKRTLWVLLATALFVGSGLAKMCPKTCFCDEEKLEVNCVDANLGSVPIFLNPSIKRLLLSNNNIKTLQRELQFYVLIQYFDLSHNHLVSIPQNSFEEQNNLLELHLNNNKISSLTNKTFEGLKSLKVLNLRSNFLEDLPDRLFTAIPQLEELNLGQNRINRIDSTAFQGLTSLRLLYLDDNQLQVLPTPCFMYLGNLAELHVGLNLFTNLTDEAFKGLNRLSVLNLANAGLTTVKDNSFRGLSVLRNLVLTGNRFTQIPTTQLKSLSRLEELSIGQNEFTEIKPNAFAGLINLRRLEVTGVSNLEYVAKGAFSENMNLEMISLCSNKRLSSFQEGALTGLPYLRRLILRDNAFTTFQESLVAWPMLKKVDVSENPIHCSCNLLWLKELLARINSSQVLCHSPLELKEKSLKTLSPDDLGCAFSGPWQHAIVGAMCGTTVAIVAILALLLYRYRRSIRDAFKDYKWNKRAMSRKEHEYQKTFSEDELPNCIISQQTLTAGDRPLPSIPYPQFRSGIPVTEL